MLMLSCLRSLGATLLGFEDGRGTSRPQGNNYAARERSGHGNAAAGRGPD